MPLSDEDKAEVRELLAESLKSDAFTAAIGKSIESQVGKAFKGLDVAAVVDKALEGKLPEKKDEEPPKAGDSEESVELKKLRAERQAFEQKLAAEKEAREAAEAARKQERLHNGVRDALAAAGVPANRIKHAMAILEVEGRLAYGEADEPGLRFKREWGEEVLPAEKAAAEWLKTDDGRSYLPPTGAQGTGDTVRRPTAAPKTQSGKTDWDALSGRMTLQADALDILGA